MEIVPTGGYEGYYGHPYHHQKVASEVLKQNGSEVTIRLGETRENLNATPPVHHNQPCVAFTNISLCGKCRQKEASVKLR